MEKKSGIEAYQKFSYFNVINSLASNDILKWNAVLNLPYQQIFIKQLMNKTDNEYQKKYLKLIEKEK